MTQLEKVTLKNVLCEDGSSKNITVEIVPFSRRNDDHVDFAFGYSDMLGQAPSPFRSLSDVAVRAVELFMVHKEDDAMDVNSDYYLVRKDKRAARTLLNTPSLQKSIFDFFENA
jgi:hypothetical protein